MTLQSYLSNLPVFVLGLGASTAASLGTGAGALPVFAFSRFSQRSQDVLQGIAAGIMLAATVMSLVIPGVETGARQHGSRVAGALMVAGAVVTGALAILMVHARASSRRRWGSRCGGASAVGNDESRSIDYA